MRELLKKYETQLQVATLTGLVSLILTEFVLSPLDTSALVDRGPFYASILLMVLIVAIMGAITNTFALISAAGKPDLSHQAFFVCLYAATLAGIELVNSLHPIQKDLLFYSFLIINATTSYATVGLALASINFDQTKSKVVATTITSLILLIGFVAIFYNNSLYSQKTLIIISLVREGGVACLPLVVAWAFKIHNQSAKKKKQLPKSAVFWGMSALGFFMALTCIGLLANSPTISDFTELTYKFPTHMITLSWLPLAIAAIDKVNKNSFLNRQNRTVATLASKQAQRFLIRHESTVKPWAATIGMQTVNYLIDHDPYDDSASQLTATLSHIRKEEIQRYIDTILHDRLLYRKVIGNQIYGIIDPEFSYRPCIDVLLLFTCVYLDAFPLIERRMKVLAALFPIIDPEVSRSVSPEGLEQSLVRMEWMFYFDYDWVDQQIIRHLDKTSYNVNIANMRVATRNRVLAHLQERNRTGNFIWITEKARNRLLMEAPYLANIIETWPVSLADSEDVIVFLIRFEELIPRIQKYYNLEETRTSLRDYDMTNEGRKFLNMVDLHLSQAANLESIGEILETIETYKWHGFKERDLALRLLIRGFDTCKKIAENAQTSKSGIQEEYRIRFKQAIESVGYPGQLLYQAHTLKRSIRSLDKLVQTCLNAKSGRFVEGWVFLSTLDGNHFNQEALFGFLGIIEKGTKSKGIRNEEIVKTKAIEGFFNIAYHLTEERYHKNLQALLNQLGEYLVEQKATPELCCLYLDAKIFVEEQLSTSLPLHEKTVKNLDQYFHELFKQHGEKSSPVISLSSRWKLFLQQSDAKNNAA